MYNMKGLLNFQMKNKFISTMQSIYSHEKLLAYSYWSLADSDPDEAHRFLLNKLANIADRRGFHYEVRLRLLHEVLPPVKDARLQNFQRWLVSWFGIQCVMKGLKWIQSNDMNQFSSLLLAQKRWQ